MSELSLNVATQLREQLDSPFAFIIADGTVYYASSNIEVGRPHSPVTQLIQGIYQLRGEYAHFALRQRIFSSAPLTEMCKGMVRVAAKRASELGPTAGANSLIEPTLRWIRVDEPLVAKLPSLSESENQRGPKQLAVWLANSIARRGDLFESDRPVSALLYSQQGELLSWGLNQNARNRTLHAEINMIQGFYEKYRGPIPNGALVLTTLQTCKMCAGMLHQSSTDFSSLRIRYLEPDLGPMARATVATKLERPWSDDEPGR